MAFVVSAGSLQAIEQAVPRYPVSTLRLSDTQYRDYAALWQAQPELRTVIDFLARNISQLGLHVFQRVSDVDRVRLTGHPLAELLDRPNPSTSRYRLINALVHDVCIYDDAFWLKVRGGDGSPVGLRRIRPARIRADGSNWLEAESYTIIGNKGQLTVPADAIVHFRGYNATDDRVGSSPIESLRSILAEEWAANAYREALWRNGARMSGYIQRPIEAPEWTDDGRRRFRDEWRAQWTGDSPRAGGTPVLEDGMTFVPAATNPRDAQYIESRKLTREECARSFHVPLPMVGILDHATFSNIREQHKQLYTDCLGPWLEMIQQEIELQLLPDLPGPSNVYVEFNIAEKLRGSFDEQAAQLQASVGAPYMTRNEARARLNLPQIDGADDLITPLNVLTGPTIPATGTVGMAARPVTRKGGPAYAKVRASAEHTDKARRTLAKFFRRQGQEVLSALGAEKGRHVKAADVADIFDGERWDSELAADLLKVNSALTVAAARETMTALGLDPEDFDPASIAAWLAATATGKAEAINGATAAALADAAAADDPIEAVRNLFDTYAGARAAQLAVGLTSEMSGFGSVEAGKRAGPGTTKTWSAGKNARPSHAVMNGQTVPIESTFSNGARWPADADALGVDDIAGCNCSVIVTAS